MTVAIHPCTLISWSNYISFCIYWDSRNKVQKVKSFLIVYIIKVCSNSVKLHLYVRGVVIYFVITLSLWSAYVSCAFTVIYMPYFSRMCCINQVLVENLHTPKTGLWHSLIAFKIRKLIGRFLNSNTTVRMDWSFFQSIYTVSTVMLTFLAISILHCRRFVFFVGLVLFKLFADF